MSKVKGKTELAYTNFAQSYNKKVGGNSKNWCGNNVITDWSKNHIGGWK